MTFVCLLGLDGFSDGKRCHGKGMLDEDDNDEVSSPRRKRRMRWCVAVCQIASFFPRRWPSLAKGPSGDSVATLVKMFPSVSGYDLSYITPKEAVPTVCLTVVTTREQYHVYTAVRYIQYIRTLVQY